MALPCALAACGGPRAGMGPYGSEPASYAAPGPAGDPWRPFIGEASRRFDVPAAWIRAVMRQESGGHEYLHGEPITSAAGAMGLMQLMPSTYADLQAQYGLGADPYDPHDNIMAGTGYIRQMFDRYGSPGFLAAYNAGPARVDDYLAGQGALPNETVNYVASIAPYLGDAGPSTGAPAERTPVAASAPVELAAARTGGACDADPDGAYDPDAPCTVVVPSPAAPSSWPVRPPPAAAPGASPGGTEAAGCPGADENAAYDPAAPCAPASRPAVTQTAWRPAPSALGPVSNLPPPSGMPMATKPTWASAAPFPAARRADAPTEAFSPMPFRRRVTYAEPPSESAATSGGGGWAIQVGAFGQADEARLAAAAARDAAPGPLDRAAEVVTSAPGLGAGSLYRARLAGLDRAAAAAACAQLRGRDLPCLLVQPGG